MIPEIFSGEMLQWYLICALPDSLYNSIYFISRIQLNTYLHTLGIAAGDDNLVTKVMLRSVNRRRSSNHRGLGGSRSSST
jgi:hypothetical protein